MLAFLPSLGAPCLTHPLLYAWSAEGQKLYAWLRLRVEQELASGACPADAPAGADIAAIVAGWRQRGYLVTYATADQIAAEVLKVSRNSVTKLIQELRTLGVCAPRRVRRGGHLFLLGEWEVRRGREVDADLYWRCFYLDGLLLADRAHNATPAGIVMHETTGADVPRTAGSDDPDPADSR